MSANQAIIVWFRRELRLSDHPALMAAVETGAPVIPVFVLDDETPGQWRPGGASRWWLAQSLRALQHDLEGAGSRLILRKGNAEQVLLALAREVKASAVYFTRGYEPYQPAQEARLKRSLDASGVECRRFGGHLLIEPEKHQNKTGEAFRVFSPFYKALRRLDEPGSPLPAPNKLPPPGAWPRSELLAALELEPSHPDWAGGLRETWIAGEAAAHARLRAFIDSILRGYGKQRNIPGIDSTSRLSPYLSFGEISARQIWQGVLTASEAAGTPQLAESYLREVVWREFSYHLLFHFPHLPDRALRPEFEAFPFQHDHAGLRAWQRGMTGYPIVDAGMRQLWQTGWMHNRVRMMTASFLIKDLLISWRTGIAWFWDTLVDADIANNSASWQWVAGCGADAAPYFRVFNPVLQGLKFDPDGAYVRRFCPELSKLPSEFIHKPWEADEATLKRAGVVLGQTYPKPVVKHDEARARALAAYDRIKAA